MVVTGHKATVLGNANVTTVLIMLGMIVVPILVRKVKAAFSRV